MKRILLGLALLLAPSFAQAQTYSGTIYPTMGGVCLLSGCTMTAPTLQADGTAALPAFSFSGDPDSGFYRTVNALPGVSDEGTLLMEWQSTGTNVYSHAHIRLGSAMAYNWSSATTPTSGAADTGLERVAAGIVGVTDGSTGIGQLINRLRVVAITGTGSPSITDSGTVYTNEGDGDGAIVNLPNDPSYGTYFDFNCVVAQNFDIKPAAGESIRDDATSGTTQIRCATLGDTLRLQANTSGNGATWVVMFKNGAWTVS